MSRPDTKPATTHAAMSPPFSIIARCTGLMGSGAVVAVAGPRSWRNSHAMIAVSTASPKIATGASAAVNDRYGMPDRLPISMFCGLPVMAAVLPMFDAVASASR